MGVLTGRDEVYSHDQKEFFNKPTIECLRDFIHENKVSDQDSIALEPTVFDEVALDFRETFNEPVKIPFIYLGVWIKAAERSTIYPRQAVIIKDDPCPEPESEIVKYQREYRCGYCGKLVNKSGEELTGAAYDAAIDRWKEHGDSIFDPTVGKCCEYKER